MWWMLIWDINHNHGNMKRFDAILFDLGDTLIYFDSDWSAVFAQARQAMLASLQKSGLSVGQEFLDDFYDHMQAYYQERNTEFIEYTTQYILYSTLKEWGFGDTPDEVLTQALKDFHSVTQAHWLPESDAVPTLETLREMGYRLALISNAADDKNTQVLVDKAGVRPYFEMVLSSAAEGIRKPNPLIFQRALERLGVASDRAAMVGDTLGADILGAKNAGIFSIWITRRADTPANRAHIETIMPDARISSLGELPGLLRSFEE